jgi:hypothetical protein
MPTDRLLRVGYLMAGFGLAIAVFGLAYAQWPFILLAGYFTACWLVWYACVIRCAGRKNLHLVYLWLIIDVAVLVQQVAFEREFGHGSLSGVEFLWLISFAPVAIPSALIAYALIPMWSQTIKALGIWAFLSYGEILSTWLAVSVLAAIQSAAYLALVSYIANLLRRLAARNSGTKHELP